jgi:PAS domain S-box-containing protein
VNKSLRERDEFLHGVGDKLPQAMLYRATNPPGGGFRFVYVSKGVEEVTGLTAECLLTDPTAFVEMIVEEDRPTILDAMAESVRTLANFDRVFRVRWPDGSVRWCHLRSAHRRLNDGSVLCEGIMLDTTELKKAREDLTKSRLELARISRLTMLGEITASLAHELNQPLTAILSNARAARFLLDNYPLDGELAEILQEIAEASLRAGDVIRRVRTWVARDQLLPQQLDLNDVVTEVERLLHSELIIRQVCLSLSLQPDLPPVSAESNSAAAGHPQPVAERHRGDARQAGD